MCSTCTRTEVGDSADFGGSDVASFKVSDFSKPAPALPYVHARVVFGHSPSVVVDVILDRHSDVEILGSLCEKT